MLEIRLFLAVLYYSGSKRAKIPYIHYNFSRVCPQPSWDREKVYYFAMQLHTKCSLSKNTLGVEYLKATRHDTLVSNVPNQFTCAFFYC